MASVRIDGKLYQIGTARRSPADAAKIARVNHRNSLRRATAYAKLAELLEDAQQEEAREQEKLVRQALRQEVMQEAVPTMNYHMMGPGMRRIVGVAVEAKLALRKAQEAAK